MGAITIRNVPDEVHGGLRRLAASRQLSVESLVRVALAEVVRQETGGAGSAQVTGFGEASMPWQAAAPGDATMSPLPSGELWGALKGSVHVPAETDLTAPLDESWQAEP